MIRVGVTGHRFLADIEKLTAAVDKVLDRIASAFGKQPVTVFTLLSEGADHLITKRIKETYNARIIAVLPLPAMDYAKDFETEISKKTFFELLEKSDAVVSILPTGIQPLGSNAPKVDAGNKNMRYVAVQLDKENMHHPVNRTIKFVEPSVREEAYLAAGSYVLEHCDVLVALWDGVRAQGKGGTGEIVDLARQRKLPLAWIRAGNKKPGTRTPTSLGPDQGTIIYERFPDE